MRLLRHALPAAALLFALAPAAAQAETFCVASPAGCSGTTQPSIEAALTAANSNGVMTRDEIRIGPGTFTGAPYVDVVGNPVDIIGAGEDATTLSSTSTNAGLIVLDIREPTSTVSDLGIDHESNTSTATGIKLAGDADRVKVRNEPNGFFDGVQMVGTEASLDEADVDVAHASDKLSRAVFVVSGADASIEDSYLAANEGVSGSGGDVTVRRSRVRGTLGIGATFGATVSVSDTEIQVPGKHGSIYQRAALIASGDNATTLEADRVTAYGTGGGFGVWAAPNGGAGNSATVELNGSILDNFGSSIFSQTSGGSSAQIEVEHTAFDDDSISNIGPVTTNIGSQNVDLNPLEPGFATPAGEPRHLRFDSPLVDAGSPAFLPPGALDLLGRTRKRDTVDMGALEYQKAAPTAVAQAAPTQVGTGVPVAFSSTGSADPDPGDALTYGWAFDDGGTATGSSATHAFATPGTHVATLTVTDPTGKAATDTVNVVVTAPPKPGGNGRPGGPGIPGGPGEGSSPAALSLTALKLKPAKFRTKRRRGSRKRAGTRISYRLSDAAVVTFKVQRRKRGRWATMRGSIVRQGKDGANRFRWSGKLRRRRLKPGRYRLAATARIAAGTPTKVVRKRFRVRR